MAHDQQSRGSRHWAEHPVGRRADRAWIGRSNDSTSEDGEEVYAKTTPSDGLVIRNSLRPYSYRYGASKPELHPLLVLKRMEEAGNKPEPKPIVIPKKKPVPVERDPETFTPPTTPRAPYDPYEAQTVAAKQELERRRKNKLLEERERAAAAERVIEHKKRWAETERVYAEEQKRVLRLEKENEALKDALDEALHRLASVEVEAEVQEPLPVQFICSGCDQTSPMFTPTHYRCSDDECACYKAEPELHDNNRRYPLP